MLRCPSQGPAAAAAATQNHGLGAEELQEEGGTSARLEATDTSSGSPRDGW